jgi:hypothetical protein
MVKTLLRFGMSVALGLALALPFMRLSPSTATPAHAQPLEADDYLDQGFADSTGLGQGELKSTVGSLINVGLSLLGVVAVVIILMGGFKWMTAGGNDEKVAEAKRLIIAGIIGIAIIMSAWAIARFVIESVADATAG